LYRNDDDDGIDLIAAGGGGANADAPPEAQQAPRARALRRVDDTMVYVFWLMIYVVVLTPSKDE
jgi:hypothetical protein